MDKSLSFAFVLAVSTLWGANSAIQSYGAYQGSHFDNNVFLLSLAIGALTIFTLDSAYMTKGIRDLARVRNGVTNETFLEKIAPPSGPAVFAACSYGALLLSIQAFRTMNSWYVIDGALLLVTPLFLSPAAKQSIPGKYLESQVLVKALLLVEILSLALSLVILTTR